MSTVDIDESLRWVLDGVWQSKQYGQDQEATAIAEIKKIFATQRQTLKAELLAKMPKPITDSPHDPFWKDEITHCCEECGFWHDPKDKNVIAQTFSERLTELQEASKK